MIYDYDHRPIAHPEKPALKYCEQCAVATRPLGADCARCGKPY
jgi:hypothetical protein